MLGTPHGGESIFDMSYQLAWHYNAELLLDWGKKCSIISEECSRGQPIKLIFLRKSITFDAFCLVGSHYLLVITGASLPRDTMRNLSASVFNTLIMLFPMTVYITTATWSSMYFEISPKKQADTIETAPNATLTKYTYL